MTIGKFVLIVAAHPDLFGPQGEREAFGPFDDENSARMFLHIKFACMRTDYDILPLQLPEVTA